MRPRKLHLLLAAGTLAVVSLGASTGGAAAYGKADRPLAQIEFSANCNNPGFVLCSPEFFGLGGVWLWIEVDANGTGDVAGAGCGHIRGAGGGAGSIRGDVTWTSSEGPEGIALAEDPNDMYYNVDFGDGPISFPQTVGHYSFIPAPAVSIQTQIAP